MAEITAGDIRNGVTFEYDSKVFQVLEFLHVKPGKGAAFVRVKMRDVKNGGVRELTFNPTAKLTLATIEKKKMTYSYKDGDMFNFMDMETYETIPLSEAEIGDSMKFVLENMEVTMLSHNGQIFSVEPPMFVELVIAQTEPGLRGDTATNVTKPATLETGAEIKVPIFINEGDKIKIDTRTGEYLGRA
ncbi:MAG: elongation factor P [Lachnospiraceae bacterium]|nr:elongation factor P [Lachnospiraceae bacterium]